MDDFQALHETDVYPSPYPHVKNCQFYHPMEPISLRIDFHVNRSSGLAKDLGFLLQIMNPLVRGGKFTAINTTQAID